MPLISSGASLGRLRCSASSALQWTETANTFPRLAGGVLSMLSGDTLLTSARHGPGQHAQTSFVLEWTWQAQTLAPRWNVSHLASAATLRFAEAGSETLGLTPAVQMFALLYSRFRRVPWTFDGDTVTVFSNSDSKPWKWSLKDAKFPFLQRVWLNILPNKGVHS